MKLLLIDGNSLINRAFYALPLLKTAKGEYTNAVYGFLTMFYRMLDEYAPTHILVAFDLKEPTFRHKQFAEYKAGRKSMPEELVPQLPLLKQVLEQMGVAIEELAGFEADDIIGTMARLSNEQNAQCVILTGDKDALQLITENTNVWLTKKGISETARYTNEMLFEDYKLTPAQICDLKGLMGDSSDNIPGVAGVGEKTALKLLEEYSTIENLYENVDKITGKLGEKLAQSQEIALFSKQLATIDCNVPIIKSFDDCLYTPKDALVLREIFSRLEFKSLLNRFSITESVEKIEPQKVERTEVLEKSIFTQAMEKVNETGKAAVCISPNEISFACQANQEYFIPISRDLLSQGMNYNEAIEIIAPLLQNNEIEKIFYNAKAVMHEAIKENITIQNICDDIMLAEYLLDAVNTDFTFDRIFARYSAAASAAGIWQICFLQRQQMEEKGILPLYIDLEMPLINVLFDMEIAGFCVDKNILQELGAEFSQKLESLKSEIYMLSGNDGFNINSPKQLGELLFEQLGLPKSKKTKTGYSTDNEVLEQLLDKHPVVPLIIEYRQAQKFKSTYIEGLLNLISPKTGRIHSTFNQAVTSTGRISSTEPNLQNIPIRTDYGRNIRKAFVAKNDDYVLVDADYSQIELRVLAHLSGDPTLIDAFLNGEDIHTRTAAEVFDIPIDEVTSTQRSAAKAVNFGIVYGISDFGLSQNISVSRKKAAEYIEKYFEHYGKVKAFMDACVTLAKAQGFVTSILGRRRDIPEIKSSNFNIRSFGERIAMNTPVQGSAADIIKLAMLNVFNELKTVSIRARLILQVHDELIIEAHKDDAHKASEILTRTMENVMQLVVPLVVEAKIGHSWYDTK